MDSSSAAVPVGTAPPSLKSLPPTPSQSTPSSAVESETMPDTRPEVNPPKSDSKTKQRILFGVKGVLKAAEVVLKAAPISGLDAIPSALLSFLDLYEQADENEENLKKLQSSVQDLIDQIELMGSSKDISEEIKGRVAELRSKLESQCNELSRLLENKRNGKNIVLASRNMERIIDTRLAVDNAIRNFSTNTIVQIWITTHQSLVKSTLEQLHIAKADYLSVWKDQCIPNTRVEVRDRLTAHLSNHSNRLVILQSSPGMGKTAIAKSIAADCDQERRLGASFFFDKSGAEQFTNSANLFVSTLARQLAEYHPRYRNALFRLLHNDSRLLSRSGLDQLKQLIIDPMNAIQEINPSDLPPTIILDGLDECGDSRALERLMLLVIELVRSLSHFQFLVSSRPEREIVDAFHSYSSEIPTENLNDIPSESTTGDILTYIDKFLEEIPSRGSTCWPPPQQDRWECARYCGGVFEIAKIRMRILETSSGVPMEDVFQDLVKDTRRGIPTYTNEYLRILRKAYFVPYTPGESSEENKKLKTTQRLVLARFRLAVGALIALIEPLPLKSLARLLKMSSREAASVLRPVSSIINVPDNEDAPIHFFHATAREFLTGKLGNNEDKLTRKSVGITEDEVFDENKVFFFDDLKGAFLAPLCLELMIEAFCPGYLLEFSHLTKVPDSGLFGSWSKRTMHMELPAHLLYAMDHWTKHFPEPKDAPSSLWDLMWNFISTCLVAWFELAAWADRIDMYRHIPQVIQRLEELSTILRDSRDMFPSESSGVALGAVMAALRLLEPISSESFYNKGDFTFVYYLHPLSELSRLLVTEYHLSPYRIFASTPEHASTPMSYFTTDPPAHVVQSALSSDGELVALSFQDGSFRVVHSEHSKLAWTPNLPLKWNSKPVPKFRWIEFAFSNTRIVGEDEDGMVWLIDPNDVLGVIGPLPFPKSDSRAVASPDGNHIFRVSLEPAPKGWSHSAVLLDILGDDISVRPLAKPAQLGGASPVASYSLGFSHDGTHVGAFSYGYPDVWSVVTAVHIGSDYGYDLCRAHFDPSPYAPLKESYDYDSGLYKPLQYHESSPTCTLKFYPPGSSDTHQTSNQSDNPHPSTLPKFPMLSSVFWGWEEGWDANKHRAASRMLGPTSIVTDAYSDMYCNGENIAYLIGDMRSPQSRQLRYSIHKGRVRVLLGPGPTEKLWISETQSYFEEGAFLVPPRLLDLSSKYAQILSRHNKMIAERASAVPL